MRFHNVFDGLLGSAASFAVVKALVRTPQKEFSGRELARIAGVSAMSAWRVLQQLDANGLVERRRLGGTDAWKIKENNFLVERLKLVCRDNCIDEIGVFLRHNLPLAKVERVLLFGSVARGEERPDSDVDVLIVVASDSLKQQVHDAALDASVAFVERFSNRLAPLVFTKKEFLGDKQLFKEARKDGIVLYEKGSDG